MGGPAAAPVVVAAAAEQPSPAADASCPCRSCSWLAGAVVGRPAASAAALVAAPAVVAVEHFVPGSEPEQDLAAGVFAG